MAGSDEMAQILLAASDDDDPMNQMQLPESEEYGAAFSSAEASNQELTNEEFVMSSGTDQIEVVDLDQVMRQQR